MWPELPALGRIVSEPKTTVLPESGTVVASVMGTALLFRRQTTIAEDQETTGVGRNEQDSLPDSTCQ